VIPDGFYTNTTLKTAMNLELASVGLVMDISNNGNPYASLRNTGESSISISFAVQPSNTCQSVTNTVGTPTADFDKQNVKSKLGWLLGFRNITYTVTAGSTVFSEALIDLMGPRYLYLVIDDFNNSATNTFISPLPNSIINKNILAKITIDYTHFSFGQIIAANPFNGLLIPDVRSYNGKVNLQKLKIQLVNEYGQPIHLNGLDFSFCLELQYE
jgi:hypothetical protein